VAVNVAVELAVGLDQSASDDSAARADAAPSPDALYVAPRREPPGSVIEVVDAGVGTDGEGPASDGDQTGDRWTSGGHGKTTSTPEPRQTTGTTRFMFLR